GEVDLHPVADLEIAEHPLIERPQLHPVRELDHAETRVDEADLSDLLAAVAGARPPGQYMTDGSQQSEQQNHDENLISTHGRFSSSATLSSPCRARVISNELARALREERGRRARLRALESHRGATRDRLDDDVSGRLVPRVDAGDAGHD